MVAAAPRFADLHEAIRARLEGRLFVAHNAPFDHGFLRQEFRRIGERFSAPALCTVRLSSALFPGECGHGLDALIARHGLRCDARHRALGDARVLPALLGAFEARVGRTSLAEAVAVQLHTPRLPSWLPPGLADELPDAPGVYILRGAGGEPIYFGKARNLRSRVLAQLSADSPDQRDAELVREVRKVEWTETGGEFGAALLEARLANALGLVVRGRGTAPAAYVVRLCATVDGTTASVEPVEEAMLDDGSEAYGPFASVQSALRTLETRAREAQLCLKMLGLEAVDGSCVARQLGGCRGACVGLEPRALHDARLRLSLAPLRLRPWPFAGAVAIREPAPGGHGHVLHVIDRWRHVGSAGTDEELHALTDASAAAPFDGVTYRVMTRWLRKLDARAVLSLPRHGPGT
jgi:DNA polymerase-3 subunit epsilon